MRKILFILLFIPPLASGQLLENHMLIGGRTVPTLVRTDNYTLNTTTPRTITLGATPVQGNLMIITLESIQSKDYTWPVGWTKVSQAGIGSGSMDFAYKFAGAGESTSIAISWTVGGTGQGGIHYFELSAVDGINPIAVGGTGYSSASATTHSIGGHTVPQGNFEIQQILIGVGSAYSSIDNSYSTNGVGISSRAVSAYKSFQPETSISVTWTITVSAACQLGLISINGLRN